MIFFDTEAWPKRKGDKEVMETYLWGGCYIRIDKTVKKGYTQDWQCFNNEVDFWNWVESKIRNKNRLYLFAHNPKYDMAAGKIYVELQRRGYKPVFFHEQGLTYIMKLVKEKKTIIILNTAHWFPFSVKEIGEIINLPKLEIDYETATIEKAWPYCKRDIEIIMTAMLNWFKFCKNNDLGPFGITAAKQAWNAYTHKFMPVKIYIHSNEHVCNIERESYSGGRTECFFIGSRGDKETYVYDVNSMYPFVMKNNYFPNAIAGYRKNIKVDEFNRLIEKFLTCALVRVKVNEPCIVSRINNHILFPVGEFKTYLCTPEIKLLQRYGKIVEVKEAAFYHKAMLFRDYVNFFYEKRQEAKANGNVIDNYLYKLMLNSLYGKFAQKKRGWKIIGQIDKEGSGYAEVWDAKQNKFVNTKWFMNTQWIRSDDEEAYNSFPAIAAHVTSYARVKLYEYMKKAGLDNIFYCDTDSLFTNNKGKEELKEVIHSKKLGYLKLEEVLHNLVINAPKDYTSQEKVRCKGIPKNAKKISNNKFEVDRWPGTATLIRKNSTSEYYIEKFVKILKREYTKGWVLSDGYVKPFEIKVLDGKNVIIDWENTSYKKMGLKLADKKQIDWVKVQYKENYGIVK